MCLGTSPKARPMATSWAKASSHSSAWLATWRGRWLGWVATWPRRTRSSATTTAGWASSSWMAIRGWHPGDRARTSLVCQPKASPTTGNDWPTPSSTRAGKADHAWRRSLPRTSRRSISTCTSTATRMMRRLCRFALAQPLLMRLRPRPSPVQLQALALASSCSPCRRVSQCLASLPMQRCLGSFCKASRGSACS